MPKGKEDQQVAADSSASPPVADDTSVVSAGNTLEQLLSVTEPEESSKSDAAPDGPDEGDVSIDVDEEEAPKEDLNNWTLDLDRHGETHTVKGKEKIAELARQGLDYTIKTMDLSERTDKLKDALKELEATRRDYETNLDMHAAIRFVTSQLDAISKMDFAKMREEDPSQYDFYRDKRYDLERAKADAEKKLDESRALHIDALSKQQAELVAHAHRALSDPKTGIKGWGQELYGKLIEYGIERGIDPEEMRQVVNPSVLTILRESQLYREALKSMKAKKEGATPIPKTVEHDRSGASKTKASDLQMKRFNTTRSVRDAGNVIDALVGN